MNLELISGDRFEVIYNLSVSDEKQAMNMANDICYEQTVEFPHELISDKKIVEYIVGRIESFNKADNGFQARISFAVETVADELTQFLNVIFGNISIKPYISIAELVLPASFHKKFKGARFGIEGIRKRLGVYDRPLLATALKPMGFDSHELAKMCYKFALGGIDIIKDDHGITNQVFSPFEERVKLCVEAVKKANAETGCNSIYVPNVTANVFDVVDRAKYAKKCGAGGLLISPGITGFDMVRVLSSDNDIDLPIICHPAFLGSYVLNENGVSHMALFGQITRLAGGDAVIYPNYGGRFSFSKDECKDIVRGCKMDMNGIRPIFPTPGGGMSMELISELIGVYGKDVIYLVGGGLFKHGPDIVENSRYFRKIVK